MRIGRKIYEGSDLNHSHNARSMIWLIAAVFVVFLTWASVASLDEVVRGSGKLVPSMTNQIVQNLEGGIVDQIFVAEGDIVERGQLLAKMADSRFQSAFQELQDQKWALSLRLARLEALYDLPADLIFDPDLVRNAPNHAQSERQLYEAVKQELLETVKSLNDAISLKVNEVEILTRLAARSVIPEIELLRAQQSLVESQSRLMSVQNEFETARAREYSETLANLRQVEEQIIAREDQLLRTNVRSPIRGIVNKVLATTTGGVLQPGGSLIELLSLESELRVEGRIDPRDVGFVYVGMPARVQLTAFDFSIYGALEGRVSHVGADTIIDDSQRDPTPYFEVYITLDDYTLSGPSGSVEIRPGMQAQIELISGQKTVLQYLIKPLAKTTEALSER